MKNAKFVFLAHVESRIYFVSQCKLRKQRTAVVVSLPLFTHFYLTTALSLPQECWENCEREQLERGAITIYVTSIFLEYS
jgi:hypothetical protein